MLVCLRAMVFFSGGESEKGVGVGVGVWGGVGVGCEWVDRYGSWSKGGKIPLRLERGGVWFQGGVLADELFFFFFSLLSLLSPSSGGGGGGGLKG